MGVADAVLVLLGSLGLLAAVAVIGLGLVHFVLPRSHGLDHVVLPLLSLDLGLAVAVLATLGLLAGPVPVLVEVTKVGHGLVTLSSPAPMSVSSAWYLALSSSVLAWYRSQWFL